MIEQVTASDDARALLIHRAGGQVEKLDAGNLRSRARDADSRREMMETGQITVAEDIRITGVFPFGHVGVNVHFSDGHARAIYPFDYLDALLGEFDN